MKIRKSEEEIEKIWNAYGSLCIKKRDAFVACSKLESDIDAIARLPMNDKNYLNLGRQYYKLLGLREEFRRISKKAENKWILVNE